MPNENPFEFNMLEVGSGKLPRGNVNIVFSRNQASEKIADNFVVADSTFLPFINESFNVTFSAFAIEKIADPILMVQEMCRVAKRRAVVRFHKSENNLKHRFTEDWFQKQAAILGFDSSQFVNSIDYPITRKLIKHFPKRIQKNKAWGAIRRFERSLGRIFGGQVEIEVWIKKISRHLLSDEVRFAVVYNNSEVLKNAFASSPYVSPEKTVSYNNVTNEPLPKFYNKTVQEHLNEDVWFVFCHQDFVILEDLSLHLKDKDTQSVYGPIGVRLSVDHFLGEIIQTNNQPIGTRLLKDEVVQSLDAQCLIAHASVFRQGLRFDEEFAFHFYDADFCMKAYTLGFDVYATQINCQHKSRTLAGDLKSPDYLASLELFREKWKRFLPVRTATELVEK
jgi:SAM-dependent methyltransferase